MAFNNFIQDTHCDCLSSAIIDNNSIFGLKTNKVEFKEQDFKTYWEKNKKPIDLNDCDEVCSRKGLSVSIITSENIINVVKIYRQLFNFAPQYKTSILLIQLPQDFGMVKHTPTSENPYHYDLYKSDIFHYLNLNVEATVRILGEAFGENV